MDYGKQAYLKVQDLSRRLLSYSKKSDKPIYYNKARETVTAQDNVREYNFYVKKKSSVKLKLNINIIANSSFAVGVAIKINGNLLGNMSCYAFDGCSSYSYSNIVNDVSGICCISLQFDTDYNFDLMTNLEINGDLSMYATQPQMCYVTNGADYYYTIYVNNLYIIYKNGLGTIPYTIDLGQYLPTRAKIFFQNDVTYLAFVGRGGLQVGTLNNNYTLGEVKTLKDNVVDFDVDNGKFYCIIGGKLYVAIVDNMTLGELTAYEIDSKAKGVMVNGGYTAINTSIGVALYNCNNQFLTRIDSDMCAFIVGSNELIIAEYKNGLAKKHVVSLSDYSETSNVIIANCDAVCLTTNGVVVLIGDNLEIL